MPRSLPDLPDLPVLSALAELKRALGDEGRAVLAAPPGSGKTTVVPLALLDEAWLAGKKIVMLEPRRLATRAAAARMASLLGERVGETVGYQIRFDRRISAQTRIEIITEGLLTRRLQSDPELPGVGLVIFDEFHERSLDADLALALTLDARANLNPDLRVLVMSATLDTQRVARLLVKNVPVIPATDWPGSSDRDVNELAPVVQASGQLYPVDIRYRPPRADAEQDEAVAGGVLTALAETEGDVLAFLPGGREIRNCRRRLYERLGERVHLFPLYGDLSSEEQDAALQPARDGRRKVILATNIAQTSLTVEGVAAVVDGGCVRVAHFDRGSGANRLETQRISRASADQRAGRAGRLGPGACYRLWSPEQHGRIPAHDTPEILNADLSRFALELAAWGVEDPARLALLDVPPAAAWQPAIGLLRELGAVDTNDRITAHGRDLARLPTTPRLGHMLLRAKRAGLAGTATRVAALLEERDGGFGTADLAARLQALHGRPGAYEPGTLRRLQETVRQLARMMDTERESFDEAATGRVVSWAYPERIARRRAGQPGVYLCEDGGEARLPETDPLSKHEWLAIAHWDPAQPRRIRLAAPLALEDVERDHAERIRGQTDVRWDAAAQAVVAEEQLRLGFLVLERRMLRQGAGEAIREAILTGIRTLGLEALPWTDAARQWQARVLSLRAWRPQEGWPDVSDATLQASLGEWLAPYLDGISRREHLTRLNLMDILNGRLDYAAQQKLARFAPTHLGVPSGSQVALAYSADGAPPVLAVKLQELFGLTTTPTVNDGRTPVMLHLLSPARRPIQVTQDLASFWARTYPEVKKELKGRYPKHPWPDDPLKALPTARAKPRSR